MKQLLVKFIFKIIIVIVVVLDTPDPVVLVDVVSLLVFVDSSDQNIGFNGCPLC